ncbi:argonaute 4-like [Olea europaea subsp. europaea]|uniref:Argonaute 4-like n=1 Tax=Olea europaea subsp. europaea TaxID=158383 RepID=A0A8S0Q311_OLEEU|nr:argonaute 4-like [Olea europaea subsp. europaea]
MLVKPGLVEEFLLGNQNVDHLDNVNWIQAKRTLKNLIVKATNSNLEHKITGLSEEICRKQKFTMKLRNGERNPKSVELTVHEYSLLHELKCNLCHFEFTVVTCLLIPFWLCELVSLQRYTRALSGQQKASLVEKSRQNPQERKTALSQALHTSNYNADPLFWSAGISINREFTTVEGRVLAPPKLTVGKNENFFPRNGRWNFNNKTFVDRKNIKDWCIVNFNARCDLQNLSRSLIRCGRMRGIMMSEPRKVFQERRELSNRPASFRVDKMIEELQSNLRDVPQFLLCPLPERKNSKLYGPWKKRNLSDLGVVTQCIAPQRVNDQYLTNVLLKIFAKLGGINSLAAVRTQSPKLEMIDSLFKLVKVTEDQKVETVDRGIFRELLIDFYHSSQKRKPEHIIIFSESQSNKVLNIELDQILEACKFLDAQWIPKFTIVVAQKNHHTKFFQTNAPDNVPPGL